MSFQKIQPSFAGGEFSPSLYARVDIQKYATGLKKLKNMFVHPFGGASNRAGTYFIAEAKYDDKKCIIRPFEFSTEQVYAIEFGEYYCRFYMNGGQISAAGSAAWSSGTTYKKDQYVTHSSKTWRALQASTNKDPDTETSYWVEAVIYEITTPYSETDLANIRIAQSADVLYIVHPDHNPKQLTRYDHNIWELTEYAPLTYAYMPSNDNLGKKLKVSALSGSVTLTATGHTPFTSDMVNTQVVKLVHYREPEEITQDFSSATTSSSSACKGKWTLKTKGTWVGTITVERSLNGGTVWEKIFTFANTTAYNAAIDTYGVESEACLVRINMTAYTSGTCNAKLQTDGYYQEGVYVITGFTSSSVVTAMTGYPAYSTNDTTDWAFGSWSDEFGYPSCVAFFQDRLVFANTYTEPQTIWFTKTSNYRDFSRSDPLVDSDGITINLPSRKLNAVNGIVSLQEMLAMTSSAEWKVGTSGTGILTPTSIDTKVQGYRGCADIEPLVIGNRVIYVQPMGTGIRDLAYSNDSGGFVGADISILSNHLFDGYQILDLAYQQEPDSLIWMIRDDGKMLSLTYLIEQEVIAWSWHDTEGEFESICTLPAETYNELWLVVKRDGKRYIERMPQRMTSTLPEDQYFLDCGYSYSGTAVNTLTGLDWLDGYTVKILANGNVLPSQTVSSGTITLPFAASKIHVGLGFISDFETLNLEMNLQDGTLQGRKVKISQLVFRFLNSRGGWLGPDENSLVEMVQRTNENWDQAIALYTGDFGETINSGYENSGRLFYRQIDPLPVTILAVIPRVTIGG